MAQTVELTAKPKLSPDRAAVPFIGTVAVHYQRVQRIGPAHDPAGLTTGSPRVAVTAQAGRRRAPSARPGHQASRARKATATHKVGRKGVLKTVWSGST
jgi:hypothetical protein